MRESMKKATALITVVYMILIMAIIGTFTTVTLSSGLMSAKDAYYSHCALYIAEGGLLYLFKYEFSNDTDWSDNTPPSAKNLGKGYFTTVYENQTEDSLDITVSGEIQGPGNTYIRQQKVHLTLYREEATIDHLFYASGNIHLHDATGIANGDIASGGFADIGSGVIVSGDVDSFCPITIPVMDWEYYKTQAQAMGTYMNGNLNIHAGTYGINSPGQGAFYYVKGNVNIKDDVTFYGTIIAEGQINGSTRNNITIISVPLDIDGDGTMDDMPAIASASGINFNAASNLTISGFMYALGNSNLNATNLNFTGSFICDGANNTNDATNASLAYDPNLVDDLEGFFMNDKIHLLVSNWQEI